MKRGILFTLLLSLLIFSGCYHESSNAKLSSIVVVDHSLAPAFATDNYEYSINVGKDETALTIFANEDDGKAQVIGDGYINITALDSLVVTVVAENGDEQNYTINLIKEKSSPTISLADSSLEMVKGAEDLMTIYLSETTDEDIEYNIYNSKIISIEENEDKLKPTIKALDIGETRVDIRVGDSLKVFYAKVNSAPKNTISIHYKAQDGQNTDDYAAYLFFREFYNVIDGVYCDYDNGYPLSNFTTEEDGWIGLSINLEDVELPNRDSINYLWFKFDKINSEISDIYALSYVKLFNYNEFWIIEGDDNIYYKKPLNSVSELSLSSGEKELREISIKQGETQNLTLSVETDSIEIEDENLLTIEQDGLNLNLTAKKTGYTYIKMWSNGYYKEIKVNINEALNETDIRLHLKQLDGDYTKLSLFLDDEEVPLWYVKADDYGVYLDISGDYIKGKTYKLYENDILKQSGTILESDLESTNELWLLEGRDVYYKSKDEIGIDIGAFKVANSWAKGTWENVADGFFNISYDAMKKTNTTVILVKDTYKDENTQKAVAVFELEGMFRKGYEIYFGKYKDSIEEPIDEFGFMSHYLNNGGYYTEYPDNKIAFDISRLLPLDNEKIYMKIVDAGIINRNIKVENFSIELYNEYGIGKDHSTELATSYSEYNELSSEWISSDNVIDTADINVYTKDNCKTYFISGPISFGDLASNSIAMRMESNDSALNNLGENNSEFVKKLIEDESFVYVDTKLERAKRIKRVEETEVDNSTSKYFPPISSQEAIGACVGWSLGYYISTYNYAKQNGIDLSNITIGANGEYSNKTDIMSPQFLYSLGNEGEDSGSLPYENAKILSEIGIASVENAPINYYTDQQNYWPSEAAFREAILHKADSDILWTRIKDNSDIEWIKEKLLEGYLLNLRVDGSSFGMMSDNDVIYLENASPNLNHAVTIVGFDDSMKPEYQ